MNDFDEKYVKNLYKFNKNELKKPSSKKKEIENIRKFLLLLFDFKILFDMCVLNDL